MSNDHERPGGLFKTPAYVRGFTIFLLVVLTIIAIPFSATNASTAATITLPWSYTFSSSGTLNQTATNTQSGSAYWWVASGGQIVLANGVGSTLQGSITSANPWYSTYASQYPTESDKGAHPQNMFDMFMRMPVKNSDQVLSVKINRDNLNNTANIHAWNGVLLQSRWQDANNYVYAGIRQDGHAIVRKVVNGVNYTLGEKQIFSGTYSTTYPDLLPKNVWMRLRSVVYDDTSGNMHVQLYTDINQTGSWTKVLDITDANTSGPKLSNAGLSGIRSDFMDVVMDNYSIATPNVPADIGTVATTTAGTSYDSTILSGNPVLYLTLANPSAGTETDLSGHGNIGTYKGGTPASATMPNGDKAADFNGSSQYLTVPSNNSFSIPTTGELTWEGWIRPDTLQFSNVAPDGYVDWMGKCQDYSPTCEWEARMYSSVTTQNRPSRLSGYVFNQSAGLGSAADWQPSSLSTLQAGQWIHVVVEYQTLTTPSECNAAYPGTINIWVDGVKQSFADHVPTGCMSQYGVRPVASNSPLNIGTMSFDTWFQGAVGKVAIYNRLLSQTEINQHYQAMTGKAPAGSCGLTCSLQ